MYVLNKIVFLDCEIWYVFKGDFDDVLVKVFRICICLFLVLVFLVINRVVFYFFFVILWIIKGNFFIILRYILNFVCLYVICSRWILLVVGFCKNVLLMREWFNKCCSILMFLFFVVKCFMCCIFLFSFVKSLGFVFNIYLYIFKWFFLYVVCR